MKSAHTLIGCLIVGLASAVAGDNTEVLPWDALEGEKRIRATVEKCFPSLEFGFYHWNGDWIIGALEDFDHERVLLLLPVEGSGQAQFNRNGEELKLPPGKPATLKVARSLLTQEGTVNSPGEAYERRIGYWVELKATDRLRIAMKLVWPCKGEFTGTYDPDNGWQTSCAFEVADQDRRDPADAYEITRSSLLTRVLDVLRAKDECIVRLQSPQCYRLNFTVRKWPPRDASEIEPLEIEVTNKIVLGVGEGRREVTPQELERNLDMYGQAAMAAEARADVRMRIHEGADDKVFRSALNALAQEGLICRVYLNIERQGGGGPETKKPNKTQ